MCIFIERCKMTDDLTPQNTQAPAESAKKGRVWPWLLGIGCTGIFLLGALAVVLFFVFKKSDSSGFMAFFRSYKEVADVVEQESDDPSGDEQSEEGVSDEDNAQETEKERIALLEQELASLRGEGAEASKQTKQATSAVMPAAPQLPVPVASGAGRQQTAAQAVTVPRGTKLTVSLNGELSTSTHNANDSWQGTLAQAITVDGKTVWPTGTRVSGVVQQSVPTGRLSNGQGILGIQLTKIGNASINGGIYSVKGESKTDRNAKVIGGTAAAGALIGALSKKSHKADHALGGAAIGAAAGTGLAAATADTTIKMPGTVTFALPSDERIAASK
jgi:hypothetical protein